MIISVSIPTWPACNVPIVVFRSPALSGICQEPHKSRTAPIACISPKQVQRWPETRAAAEDVAIGFLYVDDWSLPGQTPVMG